MRLTNSVVTDIMKKNDGLTKSTYYTAKNVCEERNYSVKGGALFVNGKEYSMDQTRNFIRKHCLGL